MTLNFPVFYHCVVKNNTNLKQYDAVNLLLLGALRKDSGSNYVSDSDTANYVRGKKRIRRDILDDLLDCTEAEIISRLHRLGFQNIGEITFALTCLSRKILPVNSKLMNFQMNESVSEEDCYKFVAMVFLESVKCPPKYFSIISDSEKEEIQKCYSKPTLPDTESEKSLQKSFSESLSAKDRSQQISPLKDFKDRFVGTFYGYYFPVSGSAAPIGAILKIYKVYREGSSILQASLMSGLREDVDMNKVLTELFHNEPITKELYDNFYQRLSADKRRCYYYEGTVEITDRSVLIIFHGCDLDARKLIFTLNISSFPKGEENNNRPYAGGLAFIILTSDSPFETRFYQMGLLNVKYNILSLKNKCLESLLALPTNAKDVRLTSEADRAWYELAMQVSATQLAQGELPHA